MHLRQAATSLVPIRPTDGFLSRGYPFRHCEVVTANRPMILESMVCPVTAPGLL
jgi:hypothetical protein